MSVFTATSGFLSIKPRVWTEGQRLKIRTCLLLRLLSLFSYDHLAVLDRGSRTVTIHARWLWGITRRREIGFDEVEYLDYSHSSIATSWSYLHGTTDEIEKYTVSLVLKDSEEHVFLAAFRGEGAVQTGWEGVLWGDDDLIDYSGDQEGAARGLVGALQKLLNVPLGKQIRHVADARGTRYHCSECGRNSPPNKTKCQYCGKPVVALETGDR